MQALCKVLQGFRLNDGHGRETKSLEAQEQALSHLKTLMSVVIASYLELILII